MYLIILIRGCRGSAEGKALFMPPPPADLGLTASATDGPLSTRELSVSKEPGASSEHSWVLFKNHQNPLILLEFSLVRKLKNS